MNFHPGPGRLLASLALSLALLAGCAAPQVADYAAEKPVLDMRQYFNLETAVGCARVCRERLAWQGETKQRSQDRRARCNRVHSAVTVMVKMNEDEKVNIHAALEMFTSGQLLFLGSITKGGRAHGTKNCDRASTQDHAARSSGLRHIGHVDRLWRHALSA